MFVADRFADCGHGRDACGLLASLAVMCEGGIEDKVDVVFNVFDFNNAGVMTKEELVRGCDGSGAHNTYR